MWNALRSDLKEFVTTVKEESSHVLSKIDAGLDEEPMSEEEKEVQRRLQLEETFTAALLNDDDDEIYRELVEDYLKTFSIDDMTDAIAADLEKEPLLQTMMERLVPEDVTYEEFWQRYYYRCSPAHIAAEWEAEEERERQERAQAMSQSILGVRSFLGGAVSAVSKSLAEDDEGHAMEGRQEGFFGTGARPPFVMNTAVDEDDEEEELGWDDDDEEEEDGDETSEQQIEFTDAATEQLQEQLKQTIEERDLLQQTVSMQAKELASLSEGNPNVEEINKLKMQLFEKESELAAMKESTLNVSYVAADEEKLASLEAAKTELEASLAAKDSELSELMRLLEETRAKLATKDEVMEAARDTSEEVSMMQNKITELDSALSESNKASAALKLETDELKEKLGTLQSEHDALRESLGAATALPSLEMAATQEALSAARHESASLASELEKLKLQLAASESRVENLGIELAASKQALLEKESTQHEIKSVDEVSGLSAASPDTASSAVKIDAPPAVEKLQLDGEEEDEWGDDW